MALLILASAFTGCLSIFVFAFLVGIPIGIASSTVELITTRIKKYKVITKKKGRSTIK